MLSLVLFLQLLAVPTRASDIWVSVNGSDAAAGTASAPFQTLQRARLWLQSWPARPATVHLYPGEFHLDATLQFGSEASGVTFAGVDSDQPPLLSFGLWLSPSGWTQQRPGVWQRIIPEAQLQQVRRREREREKKKGGGAGEGVGVVVGALPFPPLIRSSFFFLACVSVLQVYPRQLWRRPRGSGWSSFERLERARWPERAAADPYLYIPLDGALPDPWGNWGFRYRPGDMDRFAWSALDELEVVVYASWTLGRHYVASLNSTTVMFTQGAGFSPVAMYPNSGNRYYLENAVELVDTPGEWHVSRSTGLLTLCTEDDPSMFEFVFDRGANVLDGLLVLASLPRSVTLLAGTTTTPVQLNASVIDWGASSFLLSMVFQTPPVAAGRATLLYKGPLDGTHVPDDKTLFIDGNRLMLDIGWVGLISGTRAVTDGQPHTLQLQLVDGRAVVTGASEFQFHSIFSFFFFFLLSSFLSFLSFLPFSSHSL